MTPFPFPAGRPALLRAAIAATLCCTAGTLHAQARQPAPAAPTTASQREQELQNRVEQLERRIGDLESSTVLSEPETSVKRVEVYVDENGVQYTEPGPGRTHPN